ncbi:hypothetical protein WJX84_004359 [Apatococcus fuscideae]|uniref:Uncharacterized protein n=1 Tax=Apatococcus fuscideae TaxID=2026836 RepID=A0AAW1SRG8_9CHLO
MSELRLEQVPAIPDSCEPGRLDVFTAHLLPRLITQSLLGLRGTCKKMQDSLLVDKANAVWAGLAAPLLPAGFHTLAQKCLSSRRQGRACRMRTIFGSGHHILLRSPARSSPDAGPFKGGPHLVVKQVQTGRTLWCDDPDTYGTRLDQAGRPAHWSENGDGQQSLLLPSGTLLTFCWIAPEPQEAMFCTGEYPDTSINSYTLSHTGLPRSTTFSSSSRFYCRQNVGPHGFCPAWLLPNLLPHEAASSQLHRRAFPNEHKTWAGSDSRDGALQREDAKPFGKPEDCHFPGIFHPARGPVHLPSKF